MQQTARCVFGVQLNCTKDYFRHNRNGRTAIDILLITYASHCKHDGNNEKDLALPCMNYLLNIFNDFCLV